MKIILLQDIAKLGRRFDVTDVPDGYAMNKLIPSRMAEVATAENLKRIEAQKEKVAAERAKEEAVFNAALEKLAGTEVELSAEANDKEHLFKGINEEDVSSRLTELGYDISPESIVMDEAIKALGTHEIILRQGDKKGAFALKVVKK